MRLRKKRSAGVVLRAALGVAAVVVPLAGAGVAQAALAGGNPSNFSVRPNLRSVHITGTDQAQFCFDKILQNGIAGFFTGSDFNLGGYAWETYTAADSAVLDVSNQKCVIATFTLPASSTELKDYSIGLVKAKAVVPNGVGGSGTAATTGNLTDSTGNLDSNSHAGTRGNTTAPDLVSVTPNLSTNTIDYVFNKAVNTDEIAASGAVDEFGFYDVSGVDHFGVGDAAIINGNDVRIKFAAADQVASARRAFVEHGGAQNASGNPTTNNSDASLPIPGTSGKTTKPSLVSAAIAGPGSIDYTFDAGVGSAFIGVPDCFDDAGARVALCDVENYVAITSNGKRVAADKVTVIGPNTVRATFTGGDVPNFYEELVRVAVDEGAATGVNGALSLVGGADIGGNVGAFATAFTNAPDARSVTFDNTTGTVVVDFDQRVDPSKIGAAQFILHSSDGAVLPAVTATPTVSQSTGTPSDAFVTLQYNPSDLAAASALEIQGTSGPGTDGDPFAVGTFEGIGINHDQFESAHNASQIIAPSAPASAFRAVGSNVHSYVVVHLAKHSKKHSKKHHSKKHHSKH